MEIPKRPGMQWDGNSKDYTKDCNNCEWYRRIGEAELCGWGVAFKYLEKSDSPRKCEIRNRNPPENQSVKYLDELINTMLKWNKNNRKLECQLL